MKNDIFIQSSNGFFLTRRYAKIRLNKINITEIAGAENSKKIPILKLNKPKLGILNLPKKISILFIKP